MKKPVKKLSCVEHLTKKKKKKKKKKKGFAKKGKKGSGGLKKGVEKKDNAPHQSTHKKKNKV